MNPKVVIIGHGYLSRLSLVRSVAEIGCEVTVIVMCFGKKHKKPIDCFSKYVSHFYYCQRKDNESLIRILLNKCTDPLQKVVLIPDSDDAVAAIDDARDILNEYFLFPHIINKPDSIRYWMDKTNQKKLAKSVGLNVVDGKTIDIVDGHYSIPQSIQYPCFCKPLATMNGGKGGMRKCCNEVELAESLDFIIHQRSRTLEVLVEDYKEIDQEFALLGFSDGKDVCIPGILKFLAVSESNTGIARQGLVMPVGDFKNLVEQFKQFVLKMGFIGVFDIDFFQSGNVFYFCEINLRYGGSGYAITKMGVNLPAMMVKSFIGIPIENMCANITNKATYANERMCIDDWYNSFISLKEYHNILKTVEICFVHDPDDSNPEFKYKQEFLKLAVKKIIKRLLKFACF